MLDKTRAEGNARESDDILITSGCQQAYDLLQRSLTGPGDTVLIEDPVIPGLRNVFQRAGARLIGIPMTAQGIDLEYLERAAVRERPSMVLVTPNFQNPTGATLPLEARRALLQIIRSSNAILVENDIYGELRYEGDALPTLKRLDESGETILLRSFSKLAFPGLRVGWVVGPRARIDRLTEAKQWSDLHTDQLSQAVLFRFAESGRLEEHRKHMLAAGRERLHAAISACQRHLPEGAEFTRPRGGMNPVGPAARAAGCRRIAGGGRAGGRHLPTREVFWCVADGARGLADQFRGIGAGSDRSGNRGSWKSVSPGHWSGWARIRVRSRFRRWFKG